MENILDIAYAGTGRSTAADPMGMREMQRRAFERRDQQYLLIKAPPACGKSRALMFLGLDKLAHQGLRKAIVAVPQMTIGASFKDTALTDHGFFADWHVAPENNLCHAGGDSGKVRAFRRFLESTAEHDRVLVCTHATLLHAASRIATDHGGPEGTYAGAFDDCLLAIDEFHHVSAEETNRLGRLVDDVMRHSNAHIIAMTGSYFRGDAVPILLPEDEERFSKVTYTYYEQLSGYRHLRSIGIGYHFYQGDYLEAIGEVLDTDRKTIVHIPHVNSMAATAEKTDAVARILDVIGEVLSRDAETGIYHMRRHGDGKTIRVADLVDDTPESRARTTTYLRSITAREEMDVIIALGMAKEGFDWPFCEHVLTVGYRNSMTEVVQIIGRATRDCEGKRHAQFTNLIPHPDAEDEDVRTAVNNMLKAITVSLLMEQVLAPNIQFRPRSGVSEDEPLAPGTVLIDDSEIPCSPRVTELLNQSGDELLTRLYDRIDSARKGVSEDVPAQQITQVELPMVIQEFAPDLTDDELEQVRRGMLTSVEVKRRHSEGLASASGPEEGEGESAGTGAGHEFIRMGDRFINIEDLDVNLIDQVNPFQRAYEILSKALTKEVFKAIQDDVHGTRLTMSEEEAVTLWPRIEAFVAEHDGKEPSLHSQDPMEVRMAEALAYVRAQARRTAPAN